MPIVKCSTCEKDFDKKNSEIRKSKSGRNFCSKSCSAIFNNRIPKRRKVKYTCPGCGAAIRKNTITCKNCKPKNQTIQRFSNKKSRPYTSKIAQYKLAPLDIVDYSKPFLKICPSCSKEKPSDEFYKRKTGRPYSYCIECAAVQVLKRQSNIKEECVNYKGGCCQKCGYNKYIGALEFHHRDPKEKDFSITKYKLKVFGNIIKSELDKCDLLCSNCHREVHFEMRHNGNLQYSYSKSISNQLEAPELESGILG